MTMAGPQNFISDKNDFEFEGETVVFVSLAMGVDTGPDFFLDIYVMVWLWCKDILINNNI